MSEANLKNLFTYLLQMYIVELFIKWLNKNKRGKSANPENHLKEGVNINQDGEITNEPLIDEAVNCKHNFMPVDSTGLVLACTKCGFVIKHR